MSTTGEESIESQFESLALADGASYDETEERITFTPLVFHGDNYGQIAIEGSPEERAAAKNMPEFIKLLLRRIEALPEKPKIDIVCGYYSLATLYWFGYCSGRNTEDLDNALACAEKANALVKEHNVEPGGWPRLTPELVLLKFEVSQMQEDLEHACHLLRGLLAGCPENTSKRGTYAGEAYRVLWQSYEYHPNARILEEAIFFAQIAEDCPCETEMEHGVRLIRSGIAMLNLGYRTQNRDHIRRAIVKFDQALSKGLDRTAAGSANFFRSKAHLSLTAEGEPADLGQSAVGYVKSLKANSFQNKFEFAKFLFQAWEFAAGERLETPDTGRTVFIDNAESTIREIISSEERHASPTTQATTLLLAGQISEAYHIEYANHRRTELEDPSTYWMQCWTMSTAPLDQRLLANQLLSRRLLCKESMRTLG